MTAESHSPPALWGTNGCRLRGLHENTFQKGATFSTCLETLALESQGDFYLWALMTNPAQSDGEQYLKQKFTDLRRTLFVLWRTVMLLCHLPYYFNNHITLITLCWCT